MIRFKYDYDNATVRAVECEPVGFPHCDADGDKQYENTHFETEGEAWDALIGEAVADMRISTRAYDRADAALTRATIEMQRATDAYDRATANRLSAQATAQNAAPISPTH